MRYPSRALLAVGLVAALGGTVAFRAKAAKANFPASVPFTFKTFDAPVLGAASTMVVGINNLGDIVGSYNFIPNLAALGAPSAFFGQGFVSYHNGGFVSYAGPGPVNPQNCDPTHGKFSGCYFMEVRGINDHGDIVGTYSQDVLNPNGGLFRAFYKKASDTSITSYLAPGHSNSIFQKITDTGLIYGCFHDQGIDNSDQASMHGVINQLTKDNTIQNLSMSPENSSMNTGGGPAGLQHAGVFYDFKSLRHRSFVMTAGHRVDFDVPGSNVTQAWDMNAQGDVVGIWGNNTDPIVIDGYPFHGFLRDRTGKFIDIEYPGSSDTHVFGINDLGVIVGSYVDAQQNVHGFIATPGDHHGDAFDDGRGPRRHDVMNAAFKTSSSSNVRVAMMKIIPNNTPLLPASQTPHCHQMAMHKN